MSWLLVSQEHYLLLEILSIWDEVLQKGGSVLILYSESRQTRLWIQNLPHPHIPQIGLSLLNLNPHCSLKYFTHRKTKRQKEKIQKYENTKRQYTEPPSPTNSTRLPSQSWIWINPSLKCSPPTTKELESFLSSVMQTYWLTKNILQAEIFFPRSESVAGVLA